AFAAAAGTRAARAKPVLRRLRLQAQHEGAHAGIREIQAGCRMHDFRWWRGRLTPLPGVQAQGDTYERAERVREDVAEAQAHSASTLGCAWPSRWNLRSNHLPRSSSTVKAAGITS